MTKIITIAMLFYIASTFTSVSYAKDCQVPLQWNSLCSVLTSRTEQKFPKMKLTQAHVKSFELCLQKETYSWSSLVQMTEMQKSMPKTTLELLMGICFRGVTAKEGNLMSDYLLKLTQKYQFKNLAAFDANTSHIIAREWHEIDYSGEGMTWQSQKKKYTPYGVKDFKSLTTLTAFFGVESKLPYFKKIYQPQVNGGK